MACKKCGNERVLGCPNCEQYDFSDKNAEIMSLLARAEAAEKRAEQAERDRDVLREACVAIASMPARDRDSVSPGVAYAWVEKANALATDAISRCTPPASKEATNG